MNFNRLIAGFEEPDSGTLTLGDREMVGVPPESRNIGVVFQNYSLCPQMSVAANVAFPLRMRGVEKAVDNEPIALGHTLLPAALASLPREDMEGCPAYAVVSAFVGLDVERAHVTIGAQTADIELETALKVPKGAALLVMERTSWFSDNSPAEHSTFHIRPERYRFVMNSFFRPGRGGA